MDVCGKKVLVTGSTRGIGRDGGVLSAGSA